MKIWKIEEISIGLEWEGMENILEETIEDEEEEERNKREKDHPFDLNSTLIN